MTLQERIKLIIMSTPFCDLEDAIDVLVDSIPKDLAKATAELEDLKDMNQSLLKRIRKLEEENHDMRVT